MGFWVNAISVLVLSLALVYLPNLLKVGPPKHRGQGFVAPGWQKVADTFRENLESGLEKGGAFAVYHKGELVFEYSGGYADVEAEWTWSKDVLCQVYSTSKAIAAVVLAMLVDRGLLKYDEPVATYWPEFAQNGKEKITVEQLLGHQAGLAAIDEPFSLLDNPDKISKILSEQKPNWPPGKHHGYHALTLGLYEDELVRRVDLLHRDISQFFAEEVANKFGIDFQFGLQNEDFYRAARVYPLGASLEALDDIALAPEYWGLVYAMLQPRTLSHRAIFNPPDFAGRVPGFANNPDWRRLTNPSTQGYATAIGIAKFWNIIAKGGEQDGRRLLSEQLVKKLLEPMMTGKDKVVLDTRTYGRGVWLQKATDHDGLVIGHPGGGGQMGFADPHRQLSWAYITNHHSIHGIGTDPRYLNLIKATYEVVGQLGKKKEKKD